MQLDPSTVNWNNLESVIAFAQQLYDDSVRKDGKCVKLAVIKYRNRTCYNIAIRSNLRICSKYRIMKEIDSATRKT